MAEASRHELQQTGSWRKEEEEKNRKRACDSLDDEVKEQGPARKRGKRNSRSTVEVKPSSFLIGIMILLSDFGRGDLEAPGGK